MGALVLPNSPKHSADIPIHSSFCERMQNKHPNAQLLRSPVEPSEYMKSSDERYLVITPILAEADKTLSIFSNPDVPAGKFAMICTSTKKANCHLQSRTIIL